MYIILVLLAVGLGVLTFFNYQANKQQQQTIEAVKEAASATPTPPPTETPAPTEEPKRNTETITMAFAGDLVGQAGLTTDVEETGEEGEAPTYDFTEQISGVVPSLGEADVAVCTLVTTLGNDGTYDSYHMPASLATALRGAGFNLVNAASDHILDRGLEGLATTANVLKEAGLNPTGIYGESASRSLPIANIGDVKVAFLSYTYGTAGTGAEPVSVADYSWCMDILTTDYMTNKETVDYGKITSDIAAVKEAGADIVACFVYWWDNTQYYTEPRSNQTEVVDYLLENGVDIIIGGGVKVPQPIETRVVERADGSRSNCVVCYSLSSLMSCFNDVYTNLSAVVSIEISRDADTGEIWISGVSDRPLFMLDTGDYEDYSDPSFRYRLLDATEAVANYEQGSTDVVSAQAYEAIKTGIDDLKTLMGAEYAEENGGVTLEFPY